MGVFTITTNERINLAPTSIGKLTLLLDYDSTYIFNINNFTIDTTPSYSDPEGDDLYKLKITN